MVKLFAALSFAALVGAEIQQAVPTNSSQLEVGNVLAFDIADAMVTTEEQYCVGSQCWFGIGWWLLVLYLFWAMAELCDEFFVPTIEVISDRFQIPEDVAGATIMALGCNGPELFLNTIAIFQPSDIGVGAVVGGEVFNVLVLIGCALLATPAAYMPLKIAKFSFTRDVIFYAYSVGLLYWVLRTSEVTLVHSLVLLFSGVVYSTTVTFSSKIRKVCLSKMKKTEVATAEKQLETSPAMSQSMLSEQSAADPEALKQAEPSPKEGCFVSVRVQHDNRLLDRNRHWDTRFIKLSRRGLIIDTDVHGEGSRTARGIVYDHTGAGLTYAGLVNAPGRDADPFTDGAIAEVPEDEQMGQQVTDAEKRAEVIPTRDIVSCTPPVTPEGHIFELQVVQRDSTFGHLVRLEVDAKTPQLCEAWVEAVMRVMQEQMRADLENHGPSFNAPSMGMPSFNRHSFNQGRSCGAFLVEWLDWLRFPVRSLLRATIPDVHNPRYRGYWPLAFLMSMVWLAVFAFGVIQMCDEIHKTFGISSAILGFTVAAIGTSFPNVISCVAVSKQGRTGMAIANALGANIQNVFLALAVPWTIQAAINGGKFQLTAPGLTASVIWMLGTLGLMVLIILGAGCRMPKWSGAAFLIIYAVFLTNQIGGEISSCQSWPVAC